MTMLKNKHITFSLILVCLVMVSPMVTAQLGGLGDLLGGLGLGGLLGGSGGLGGLLGGLGGSGGLGGLLGGLGGSGGGGLLGLGGLLGGLGGGGGGGGGGGRGLLGLINIAGIVRCSVNGNVNAPAFANASLQLQCGGQDDVVSTSTTNSAGLFSILVNPTQLMQFSNCKLVVTTPLSTCNAALPTGQLVSSSLALVGETVSGVLRIANLRPTGFVLA